MYEQIDKKYVLNVLQACWILKFRGNYNIFLKSITYKHLKFFSK